MNEKFFLLPQEKQQRIINAGFSVFSQSSYRKSPVGEIAAIAGISKSLLFHYFRNKKELYLFLWEKSAELTKESLVQDGCYEPEDLFDAMEMGMKTKLKLMRNYPDLAGFVLRVYYEKDPEVAKEISSFINKSTVGMDPSQQKWFDPDKFVPGLDLAMMYRDMFLASEGLIWEKQQEGQLDVQTLETEFSKLLNFWRSIYLRKTKDNIG